MTEKEEKARCNKLRAMLRRAWSSDPRRYAVLKANRRPYKGPNKRQRFEHQCNICKEWFKQDEVQVDHIIPCGSFLKLTLECFGGFAWRLFEGELQKLCKGCHNEKTKEDRHKK